MATTLLLTTQKTLPIIFSISLFLITIFLFTKHTLDPNYILTYSYSPKSETGFINLDPLSKPQILETNLNNSISKTESGFDDSDSVEQNPGFGIQSNDLVLEKDKFFNQVLNNVELVTNDSVSKTESGFDDSDSVDENPGFEILSNDLSLEKKKIFDENEVGLVRKSVEWGQNCNMHSGKWVKDDEYPVYKSGSCPFVDEAFDCQSNGRVDQDYMKWRWQPDECQLPRFNGTDFLVRLRGKRLMLVGDSMNRNQYESLLCLLYESLPNKSKMYEVHGYKITKGRGYYVFKFEDYNCTVEFVRSHFLVREGTRINGQGNSNPTLSMDKIDKSAGRWKKADILVFNTGHWWVHGKTSRGKSYFKEGDYVYPKFDAVEAFRRALKTWGKWIDKNMNQDKLVFYRGYSSAHFRGGEWDSGGTCHGETEPIKSGRIIESYPLKMKIIEEVIQEMKFPVVLLNVTRLTNFRKDGHPSVYGKNVTGLKKVSTKKEDCSHWCLPGVPDAWNELIYSTLVARTN